MPPDVRHAVDGDDVDVLDAEIAPASTRKRLEREGVTAALNEDVRSRHPPMVRAQSPGSRRKRAPMQIVVVNHLSLDGVMQGPGRGSLFGRRSYEQLLATDAHA